MTTTAPTVTDWYNTQFAAITATPHPSVDRPTYHTVGHVSEGCPALKGEVIVRRSSLAGLADANEYWDGEVEYLTPWPCPTCVSVRTTGATIAFEAPRNLPSPGATAAPRTAIEPDPQADAELAEAKAYATAYAGSFEFMLDMRLKARRGGTFTPNMVAAILRCKAADAARASRAATPATVPATEADGNEDGRRANLATNAFAGTCRSCRGEVAASAGRREKVDGRWTVLHSTTAECAAARPASPAQAPATPLPDVPDGKYAVTADAGHTSFYQIRKPTEGKWAGYTFVDLLIGSPVDWRHQPVKGAQKATILAKIAADPREALARYGREFKQCGACDAPLSHDRSKKAGYGQRCAEKRGYAW